MLNRTFGMMLLATAMVVVKPGHAAEPAGSLIGALSSCRKDIFAAIGARQEALSALATVKQRAGGVAFIAVPDRDKEDASAVRFSAPYQDAGVPLIAYFDEVRDIGALGKYYAWGFIVPGKLDDVARQVAPRIAESKRLRATEGVYVRSEQWKDGHWQADDQLTGDTPPAPGTVERVLLIEDAEPGFPGAVRIGCSLQGSVTAEMLATERPDL
ncbi:Hypothetical Protein RRSL_04652 [Ralstonia solanacearum UW551]|nr:hypothetical protein [Ralstonia solanacearum]ATI29433.1 hypothetical protein CCY86_18175 [Ralstonia solanacearum]ATJ88196.1 hypothetical protein CDC59_18060 [Ralstonia solanacearum]EAP74789.1 Hypothetical Protein RRSL_04652 [Ralstonia solanacearum UW551]KEI30393.1 hypothetical protein CQ06_06825 [Ralstonia solanacearum]KFX77982.1 hypothetical protein KR98_16220 [Ralstonia solanacearum]